MAKLDVRELNYITCGKKQNTFNISYCYTDDGHIAENIKGRPTALSDVHTATFFGDIGEYQTMLDKYGSNQCSFYDINHKIIVHNLYEITKSLLKTTAKKHTDTFARPDNIDIFAPVMSSDFIHVCQFENFAYGLTDMTNKSPVVLSTILNNFGSFDATYHYNLTNDTIGTFLCPKPSEVINLFNYMSSYDELILNAGDLSDYAISTIFNVKRDLKNVQHNYIVEIPEATIDNQYWRGYVQCDTIVAKNHLDYSYTMHMDSLFNLSGCREYCNINVCGGQLYLTYRDNVDYQSDAHGGVEYVGAGSLDETYDSSVIEIDMQMKRKNYGYQHIEVINSWNRWDGSANAGHKSSMFSLRLVDTGLNESTIDEEAKIKLRENIQKNVRAVIESITPANCQLFNVQFEGK